MVSLTDVANFLQKKDFNHILPDLNSDEAVEIIEEIVDRLVENDGAELDNQQTDLLIKFLINRFSFTTEQVKYFIRYFQDAYNLIDKDIEICYGCNESFYKSLEPYTKKEDSPEIYCKECSSIFNSTIHR